MAKVNNAVAVEKSRDDRFVEKAKMLVGRVIATFAASGLSVVGAGSLFGIEVWKSIALAGGLGVATVMEAVLKRARETVAKNCAAGFVDDISKQITYVDILIQQSN